MVDLIGVLFNMMFKGYDIDAVCLSAFERIIRRCYGVFEMGYLTKPAEDRENEEWFHYISDLTAGLNQDRFYDGSVELPTIQRVCNDIVNDSGKIKKTYHKYCSGHLEGKCPICEKKPTAFFNKGRKHTVFHKKCYGKEDLTEYCGCKCKDCGDYLTMCRCALRCGPQYMIKEKIGVYSSLQAVLFYMGGNLPIVEIIMGYVSHFVRAKEEAMYNDKTLYRLKCKSCLVQVPLLNPLRTCPRLCNPLAWIRDDKHHVQWECAFCSVVESKIKQKDEMAAFIKKKMKKAKAAFPEETYTRQVYSSKERLQRLMNIFFEKQTRKTKKRFDKHLHRKANGMHNSEYNLGLTTIPDFGCIMSDSYQWLYKKLLTGNLDKNTSFKMAREPDFYGHPLYTQEPWFGFNNTMSDKEFKDTYWNLITFAEHGPTLKELGKVCDLPRIKYDEDVKLRDWNNIHARPIQFLYKVTYSIMSRKNTRRFQNFIHRMDHTADPRFFIGLHNDYLKSLPYVTDYDYDSRFSDVYKEYMSHYTYKYAKRYGITENWYREDYYKDALRRADDEDDDEDRKFRIHHVTMIEKYWVAMKKLCRDKSIRFNSKEIEEYVLDITYHEGRRNEMFREVAQYNNGIYDKKAGQDYPCRFYRKKSGYYLTTKDEQCTRYDAFKEQRADYETRL